MLNDENKNIVNSLINKLNKEEKIWLSGYLLGSAQLSSANELPQTASNPPQRTLISENITIIYATETGNSKKIANELAKTLKKINIRVKLKAIEQYTAQDIAKETYLIVVISTHGDGELPELAHDFYQYLEENNPQLENLHYNIVALGDINYPLFCQAGKILHQKLHGLNATEFYPIQEFDLDFMDHIEGYYNNITKALYKEDNNNTPTSSEIIAPKKAKNKYIGTVINNILLNDVGSDKQIYHLELHAEDLVYEPGDALGIKLEGMTPRLYSISSSLLATMDEVHLTVAKADQGVCSTYLSELKKGDKVEFYIAKNNRFRLPANDKDIILIGPGTGVAPFRSFIAERNYHNATGRIWLFFGSQHAHTDFLYQTEWQEYLESDLPFTIDLAFSRDQKEKLYVQHRILEKREDIKSWVDNGSYVYVCGDKKNMATDVKKAFMDIMTEEVIEKMIEDDRYLQDVY